MKVGLSLGGGGARGLSHIVVFEVLDELGVEVVEITGSSIGALMGMGYANGMSGREIRSFTLEKFADSGRAISQLWSLRPSSLKDWFSPNSYSLGQIDPLKILSLFTPIDDLPENVEDLKIPLNVIATDYFGWHDVVITEGNLKTAVGASIAIPFVFKPVERGGSLLIDGNITNPLPFDRMRDDLDVVIAVDVVGGPLKGDDEIPNGVESMFGATQIMMQAVTKQKLASGLHRQPDVLITPPINEFRVLDFLKASTIIRVTETVRDEIKRQIADVLDA